MDTWDKVTAAAQPIVDELEQLLNDANTHISALNAQISDANQQAATLGLQLTDVNLQLAAALARIKVLETTTPTTPVPPVPTNKAKFGACPAAGGTSLSAAQTVISKYGKGGAVRVFYATGAAERPADAGLMHCSWKPTQAQITEAWVTSVCKNLKPGDCVEVWHETDAKVRKGSNTLADLQQRKNTFYDIVKKVRPDLLVVNTLTAWVFEPTAKLDPEVYAGIKCDVLGIDCDGIHPTKLPYTDFKAETTAAQAFIKKHGIKYLAVPEFGVPLIPSDPNGVERAKHYDSYYTLWSSSMLFVTVFDYNSSPGYTLVAQVEIDGLKKRVNA